MDSILATPRFRTLTKSDTVLQTYTCASITGDPMAPNIIQGFKSLYVVVTGDVVVKNDYGTAVTFTAVPAGVELHVEGHYLMAATSATVIGYF
jgi:hypothetical protein